MNSSENSSKTKGIRGKVFISSTCFDLKDLRAELAKALKEWGYLPIWNESHDFPKRHGFHSHDTCILTKDMAELMQVINIPKKILVLLGTKQKLLYRKIKRYIHLSGTRCGMKDQPIRKI
ncbi:MAG: DUF4062 domain-containing protein [Nitrospirae bacterium]|nr:DUF4062 domain-containing protein [Nitrospirota bacterium]